MHDSAGLAVGGAWLVATHVGHLVLCRLVPGFLAQVNDLYAIRDRSRLWSMVGAVVLMAVAEEMLFRGVVQGGAGLLVSVLNSYYVFLKFAKLWERQQQRRARASPDLPAK